MWIVREETEYIRKNDNEDKEGFKVPMSLRMFKKALEDVNKVIVYNKNDKVIGINLQRQPVYNPKNHTVLLDKVHGERGSVDLTKIKSVNFGIKTLYVYM